MQRMNYESGAQNGVYFQANRPKLLQSGGLLTGKRNPVGGHKQQLLQARLHRFNAHFEDSQLRFGSLVMLPYAFIVLTGASILPMDIHECCWMLFPSLVRYSDEMGADQQSIAYW